MPRTCESTACLKIEHKQRQKCCNLRHFGLSDGKNPRKYYSCCPWQWLKYGYLDDFRRFRSRHDLRFWRTRKYQRFLHSSRQKSGSKSGKNAVIYKGLVPSRAKKLRKCQRFGVHKLPKHCYLQCFVPSTFYWHSKTCVNTHIFGDQLATK